MAACGLLLPLPRPVLPFHTLLFDLRVRPENAVGSYGPCCALARAGSGRGWRSWPRRDRSSGGRSAGRGSTPSRSGFYARPARWTATASTSASSFEGGGGSRPRGALGGAGLGTWEGREEADTGTGEKPAGRLRAAAAAAPATDIAVHVVVVPVAALGTRRGAAAAMVGTSRRRRRGRPHLRCSWRLSIRRRRRSCWGRQKKVPGWQ